MKKEYIFLIIVVLFLISYVLDRVAGPVYIVLRSPFEYINPELLSRYPFTTVAIIIKTIALFSSILFVFSLFEKKFFTKAIVLAFLLTLFELYSIQQIANNINLIPIQWLITISWTGILLIPVVLIFLILGIAFFIIDKTFKKNNN